jgi:hypothetical protein
MTYQKARKFSDVVFGEAGKDTLTVRNGKRALTRLLLDAKRLDKIKGSNSDDDKEAMAVLGDLRMSPVLRSVLCKSTTRWLRSRSSIVARINRAELDDHDARIVGTLLISQFKGQLARSDRADFRA